ncbi:hypothetical protein TNCV_1820401 [Trichonephila clavipes]|nr:hypothetical protein TNCV_1820401 [Trichonephila clavipes]
MWNPQKAGYLLRNILGSKVVKTNLKGLPYQLFCYQRADEASADEGSELSILKAHCHPPINDRSIANASCTAIGPPPLKSRPSLQAQVSKTMKIRVPDRG